MKKKLKNLKVLKENMKRRMIKKNFLICFFIIILNYEKKYIIKYDIYIYFNYD